MADKIHAAWRQLLGELLLNWSTNERSNVYVLSPALEQLFELARLRAQILFTLTMQEDKWIPISRGRALAAKFTRGAITPISRSGHLMQEDGPEAIIAAMFSPPKPIET